MKSLDIHSLAEELNQFSRERDWDKFHTVKNLSMALSVEASELAEIFQWLTEEESNSLHRNPLLKEKLEDEVADVFIYLLRIISKSEIDLEASVRRKMLKNAEKYPVERARGNAKKYDEF